MVVPNIVWALTATGNTVTSIVLSATGTQYNGVPAGQDSDHQVLYLLNNSGGTGAIDSAYDCRLAVYDGVDPGDQGLAVESPVANAWLKHKQLAYGLPDTTPTAIGPYTLGGLTKKFPVRLISGIASGTSEESARALIGDSLSGSPDSYFKLEFWLSVPASATDSSINMGLWLEYNYVS